MKKQNKDDQLIYNIKGKEYLLVEQLITSDSQDTLDELKKIGAIHQGVKEIHKSLFGSNYAIVKYLIPTDKLDEYRS